MSVISTKTFGLNSGLYMLKDHSVEAMQTYKSESRSFPHPRSPESLRGIASNWGSVVGVEYAEAFELIRSIR